MFWESIRWRRQGRFIDFLVDSTGNSNPLTWASRRIKRVVKSTLAAETHSFAEAAENVFLLANFIEETIMFFSNKFLLHECFDWGVLFC